MELLIRPNIAGVLIEENQMGSALVPRDAAAAAKYHNIESI
jgi:hypothetical protein